jgi:hypothetical protein
MTRWVHGVSKEILRAAFGEYLGLGDENIDVLVVLYSLPGVWVKAKRLQRLLDSHRPPKRQAVYERIRVLREAMEVESIESGGQLDDAGYRLTEIGFDECRKALRIAAEAMVKDGPEFEVPYEDAVLLLAAAREDEAA